MKLTDIIGINKLYIYGTGEIGRMLCRTAKLNNADIVGFICSDGYKGILYRIDGKRIF